MKNALNQRDNTNTSHLHPILITCLHMRGLFFFKKPNHTACNFKVLKLQGTNYYTYKKNSTANYEL